MSKHRIVTIIPARGGSKGVPRKNIKLLNGKPLIAYTIEASLKSGVIDRVIVSTEDKEIAEVAKQYGAEVIVRPSELAQDHSLTDPVMLHALEELEKSGYYPDLISLIQPTSPLLNAESIKIAVEAVIQRNFDSCFTAFLPGGYEFKWRHVEKGIFERADYPLEKTPRRQDLPKIYHENGAFYITRTDLFKRTVNRLGGSNARISLVEMNLEDSLQIDTVYDFWLIDQILRKREEENSD